jgi:uncharacterized SAM-binding protein YcdF (DUF218 family)
MFFMLSKLVYFFLSPFTWLLISLGIFLFTKRNRLKKWSKITCIFIALFFTHTIVFKEFMRLWEIPSVPIDEIEHHDVAIVLGGMFDFDNAANRLSAGRGSDRLWQALDLYYSGKVKKLLISGDSGYITDRGLHEAEQVKAMLTTWNIPAEDIIVEGSSRNTYENAVESVRILKEEYPDFNSFILVTSAFHMRRSKACFAKQNLVVTVYSTDQFTGGKRAYHWDEYIILNPSNFDNWFTLIKEWVGYSTYKIMGYL